MKTKIIYISGDEVFNIADIRAAFDAVRSALNLGKDTVLFGVPVDQEDAGFATETTNEIIDSDIVADTDEPEFVQEERIDETETIEENEPESEESEPEESETIIDSDEEVEAEESDVAPILSVLSSGDNDEEPESEEIIDEKENVDEEQLSDITTDVDETVEEIIDDSIEPDLEKLLSEMTPLNEDVKEEENNTVDEVQEETSDDNVDVTLEQLATEYIQAQDNITQETKSSGRGKIGKLRNILPFKQSKHKDQGFGDLFGWAGTAANDEDFSVPGFFTSAASKK